jgi:hypothetical protein
VALTRSTVLSAAAACAALGLVACSGSSSSPNAAGTSPAPTTSTGTATLPAGPVSPTPAVTQIGNVKPTISSAKLSSVFGTSLSGPVAASGPNPTFQYGDVHSSSHLVVSVTIYSPSLLRSRGTTANDFYEQNNEPTAEQISGIGKKAFIVQDQITVLTNHGYVLQVAANQLVDEDQLKSAAQAAAKSL